jgi:hypothetical protein
MSGQLNLKYTWYLFLIPLGYLVLYFYLIWANGPFYLSRIDPDYVYLLNGMNCSVLNFERIGHTDHPGTPFQIFIGLCIDLGYLLSGKDGIVNDVLTRPEFYLRFTSHIMAGLFSLLLIWAGKVGHAKGRVGALLLQTSPFLSAVVLDLSVRIMPDRFGFMLTFLIVVSVLRLLNEQKLNSSKQAIGMGSLTGIAIATKVIFIPVLFVPLVVLKKRFLFVTFLILGFLAGVSPILGRLEDFRNFVDKVMHHDGIYGAGAERIFNMEMIWNNLKLITTVNLSMTLCLSLVLVTLVYKFISKKRFDNDALFLIGYCIAVTIAVIMVAKHFKNYYLVPALIMSGSALFVVYKNWTSQEMRILITGFAFLFGLTSVRSQLQVASIKKTEIEKRRNVENIVNNSRMSSDYFLIKPEWSWGPAKEYGLIFGLSYVRHRDRYEENIRKNLSSILSFEGSDRELRSMRVYAVPDKDIVDKSLLTVDQDGRPAADIISYMESRWELLNIDTLILPNEDLLIRLSTGSQISQK